MRSAQSSRRDVLALTDTHDLSVMAAALRVWLAGASVGDAARTTSGQAALGRAIAQTEHVLTRRWRSPSGGCKAEHLELARSWMDASALLRTRSPEVAARCYEIAISLIVCNEPAPPRAG